VSRPTLFVCRRCDGGETLYAEVKRLRREQSLKPLFKVEFVKCLKGCDTPCTIKLKGPKRSTYTRVDVRVSDAGDVVRTCVSYAELAPGEELPERRLPGEEG
jgi:predicted metal-binding protein